eukprot:SAG31_NODE_692_length_12772_cov_15.543044_7_plen_342_part_00
MVATSKPDLGAEVVLACTAKRDQVQWRPVVTAGGLIYDGSDITAAIAALGSGLPGLFALRLVGDGPFVIPRIEVMPYQELRIICTDAGSVRFSGAINLHAQGKLVVFGTVGALHFGDGEHTYPITIAESATLTIDGTIGIAASTIPEVLMKQGDGQLVFEGGETTVLDAAGQTAGTFSGSLPGAVTLDITAPVFDGGTTGTVTFDGSDLAQLLTLLPFDTWDSGGSQDEDGHAFTLYRLPPPASPFPDNADGGRQYLAYCQQYGLRGIGCSRDWGDRGQLGMNRGDYSCQIDGPLHSNTGWTRVGFMEDDGSMRGVDSGGSADGDAADGDGAFWPVCAREH